MADPVNTPATQGTNQQNFDAQVLDDLTVLQQTDGATGTPGGAQGDVSDRIVNEGDKDDPSLLHEPPLKVAQATDTQGAQQNSVVDTVLAGGAIETSLEHANASASMMDRGAAAPVQEPQLTTPVVEVAPIPVAAVVADTPVAPVVEVAAVPEPQPTTPVVEAAPAPVPVAAVVADTPVAPVVEVAAAPVPEPQPTTPVVEAAPAPVPVAAVVADTPVAPVVEVAAAPVQETVPAAPVVEAAPVPVPVAAVVADTPVAPEPTKDGHANNGFGNGDQAAPGNSTTHNQAENDTNSHDASEGGAAQAKDGHANNGFGNGDQAAPGNSTMHNQAENAANTSHASASESDVAHLTQGGSATESQLDELDLAVLLPQGGGSADNTAYLAAMSGDENQSHGAAEGSGGAASSWVDVADHPHAPAAESAHAFDSTTETINFSSDAHGGGHNWEVQDTHGHGHS